MMRVKPDLCAWSTNPFYVNINRYPVVISLPDRYYIIHLRTRGSVCFTLTSRLVDMFQEYIKSQQFVVWG